MAEVVLVEDDEHLCAYLEHALQRAGHAVTTFSDGDAAWTHLAAAAEDDGSAPDAAIVDVMLPGLHGFGLARRIDDHPTLTNVAVLLVSARGREDDVLTGFERGAADYLVKPFDGDELLQRLQRALR